MSKFVSIERFKEQARDESEGQSDIRESFIAKVENADDKRRELLFTISTESVDRVGDKIMVEGWRLDNYRKNPIVLWAHDYTDYPVARSEKIWTEDGKLKSLARFVPADNPATGNTAEGIYRLYKEGFMSASSVGFRPIKWAWTEDTDRQYGIDFMEQELLEYSLVPVPANAEALIEARGLGIDTDIITGWALGLVFPKGVNPRSFENFLSDSGQFSQKEAVRLASLAPKAKAQSDSDLDIIGSIEMLQQVRKSLR